MLVRGVDDPVDARVVADLLVGGVYHDDFVVFHCGVLVDPVRVQYTQVSVLASSLLLSKRLQVTFKLQLVNTLVSVGKEEESIHETRAVRMLSRHGREPLKVLTWAYQKPYHGGSGACVLHDVLRHGP